MCRACRKNGEERNACRLLVGKPEGKRLKVGGWIMLKCILDEMLRTGLI
jgi:hypothetical protein